MATVTHLVCEYRKSVLGLDTRVPRFSWWMDDARPGARQTAYHVQVGTDPEFEPSTIAWDSGEVMSARSVLLPYSGAALQSLTRYHYRVRICDDKDSWCAWADPEWFETAFLDPAEWQANWIGPDDDRTDDGGPPPYLRCEFEIAGEIREARMYAAARGLVELSLNGSPVGDAVLSPGWTDYDWRCQYVTHDTADLVRNGTNVVGAILGDGWYAGRIARVHDGDRIFGARPQLLLELHVRTTSGALTVIRSDGSWTWRTGPILASDIYDGERYDARCELPGWDTPAADGSEWRPVRVVGAARSRWDGSTGRPLELDAKIVPPVRRVAEIVPGSVTEPAPGRYIYDLGQNISGWARIRASATRDATVTLRFAEMLNPDGTLYLENLRTAEATDSYTCADDGEFSWEPRFTFHGFRYIEVSGLKTPPPVEQVTGVVVQSDLEQTGKFACSHPLVNQLQRNIQWGQRGNYLEAPTDCPQRDERLAWTGDAQVFIPTGAFNMNVAQFFAKWQRDLADAQGEKGTIPSVAPVVRYSRQTDNGDGGPAWSDAFVICPWTVLSRYGDLRLIERHFDAMYQFVDSMRVASRDLVRSDELVDDWCGYGDWVSMDSPAGSRFGATPKDLIGTAYFAHSTNLLRLMAQRLGRTQDVVVLAELHASIVAMFRREFVTEGGRVLGDTQTSYAIALAFDLLPEAARQAAVNRLVRKLELRDWKLATGFVGTPLLCPVLTRFGRADVAYKLLLQEEFPSWLYTVKQGATTMWERWNSYTHEDGFGPVDMNSFNHYAYGSVGDWLYSSVAGLCVDMSDPEEPPIRIEPNPGFGITKASAELVTSFGLASSSWVVNDGAGSLTIVVPANATARVVLPSALGSVDVEGMTQDTEDFLMRERPSIHRNVFHVGAGTYTFRWQSTPETNCENSPT